MYRHVTQFETRRQRLEREFDAIRERHRAARARSVAGPSVGPPRYELALLTWASAYALLTLFLALLGPVIASLPLALRSLVLSVTMVIAITWLVLLRLTRVFGAWLNPSA